MKFLKICNVDKRLFFRRIYDKCASQLSTETKTKIKKIIKKLCKTAFGREIKKSDIRRFFENNLEIKNQKASYAKWLKINRSLVLFNSRRILKNIETLSLKPKFLIVISVEKYNLAYLRETLLSVFAQSYQNFSLVIVTKDTLKTEVKNVIQELSYKEPIKIIFRKRSIVSAYNEVIDAAAEDICFFMGAGDKFTRETLYYVANQYDKNLAVIYTDEDKILKDGTRVDPVFKPDFNYDFLLSDDYIGRAVFFNIPLIKSIGGFDDEFYVLFGWEAILRLLRVDSHIKHLPYQLYSRAKVNDDANKYLRSEEKVNILIKRCHLENSIQSSCRAELYNFDVKYKLTAEEPSVTILCYAIRGKTIEDVLNKTSYNNYKIVVIGDNQNKDIPHSEKIIYISKSEIKEKITGHNADFFLFLNDEMRILDKNWLKDLVAEGARKNVAAVSPLILRNRYKIYQAGTILGGRNLALKAFSGSSIKDKNYLKYGAVRRNYSAFIGIFLVKSSFIDWENSSSEGRPLIKFQEKGYRNVFTPYVRLRREGGEELKIDKRYFEKYHDLFIADPAYNLNLSLENSCFDLDYKAERLRSLSFLRDELPDGGLLKSLDVYHPYQVSEDRSLKLKECHFDHGLSIMIVTKNAPHLIIPLLKQLFEQKKSFEKHNLGFEILVGDTGTTDSEVLAFYKLHASEMKVLYGLEYQFSRSNNILESVALYDALLLLNNDIILSDDNEALFKAYRQLMDDASLGCVGAVLHYLDGRIQHMGCDFLDDKNLYGLAYHVNHKKTLKDSEIPQEKYYFAVTGAFLMIKHQLYCSVNGLDERYQSECQDVALCLDVARLGFRSKCLNLGHTVHLENATRPKGEENWTDRELYLREYADYVRELKK